MKRIHNIARNMLGSRGGRTKRMPYFRTLSLFSAVALVLLAGCGNSGREASSTPPPLNANNLNLIFVVSEDLEHNAPGDINPATANLTNRGLQRSLQMGTFLQQRVLGGNNVTAIYALEAMTHLQTANHYPDLVPLESIQQFAMLNQVGVSDGTHTPVVASSYPIFASYSLESLPDGVAHPVFPCAACSGLDFNDTNGDNEALIARIIDANIPGYYVFSAPWNTVSTLMANTNRLQGYNLTLPAHYAGPNHVYAISIAPSEAASVVAYDSKLDPSSTYPELPAGKIATSPCTATPFHIQTTGENGTAIPVGININETIYFIRHAEAHPVRGWEDGNFVGAGQWRALALASALRGKVQPTQVISVDPANAIPPGPGRVASSYVRTSMTVEPYAIAHNVPHNLAADLAVFAQNPPQLSTGASDYFFKGDRFSNQVLLVAWEHLHIPTTVNALLASYGSAQTAPDWPDDDYDTIWTVKLDAHGDLTVSNEMCEGIDSATLPTAPPQF